MSASLVLGILVSDVCGFRLLTAARADGNPCEGKNVSSKRVKIAHGLALGGVAVRDVMVNGQVVERGVIMGSVLINDMMAANGRGVLVGDNSPVHTSGVLVGDNAPAPTTTSSVCTNGVLVGDNSPIHTSGVLVGDNIAPPTGVIIAEEDFSLSGVLVGDNAPAPTLLSEDMTVSRAVVSISGLANGGVLVGDNITIVDGVITGQNLVLTGATVRGGAVNIIGSVTEVQVSPAN